MTSHQRRVHRQFDPRAAAYLRSEVHARGADLRLAQELIAGALAPGARALDVGCGAGHLTYLLAERFANVAAVDLSGRMLSSVRATARERRLEGVHTHEAAAEALPFEDGAFHLVATRYSAHHWQHWEAALGQMRRVVKAGGHGLFIDSLAPDDALADTHLQAIELLRDPSHVRNRSAAEWQAGLAAAGFEIVRTARWRVRIDFASWIARMRPPARKVAMIRQLESEAPQEVREALELEPDGSFMLPVGLWWARAGHLDP
ncbi:MAG: class I SAM-dependent methyltransferase [Betaproteobacteria bacterium]|nr:class I SAM-dependent methyltransferase [Betaproteobacteria bacterium]